VRRFSDPARYIVVLLSRAWPSSRLIVVENAGHQGTAKTRDHVLTALDAFGDDPTAGDAHIRHA
jgi:hypothetical protein